VVKGRLGVIQELYEAKDSLLECERVEIEG
jgi:hypothetical protein